MMKRVGIICKKNDEKKYEKLNRRIKKNVGNYEEMRLVYIYKADSCGAAQARSGAGPTGPRRNGRLQR